MTEAPTRMVVPLGVDLEDGREVAFATDDGPLLVFGDSARARAWS